MLNYQIKGKGFPIVLIHGLFGSASNLSLLGNALAKEDFQVITVDCLNHGSSPRDSQMDYPYQAKSIKQLLEHLNLQQAHLIGHSMGGKVALAFAQLHPSFCRSVIAADIAPVAYQHSHQDVFEGLRAVDLKSLESRQQAVDIMSKYIPQAPVIQFLTKSLYKEDQQWHWRFDLEHLANNYADIMGWPLSKQYTGPCLFIKGELSKYIQAEYQTTITEQYPQFQFKMIPQTGHWLHAEKPDLFNRICLRFIQSQD